MAKILLRSGHPDDFQAVGGGGQTVFDSAIQMRETLRLRKQHAALHCLAIPQRNDEGDRVDWYSPLEGRVISWKSADNGQREQALRQLERIRKDIFTLAARCLTSEKTTQQLFGALLENTLQFPGENHVYLVDGNPVISFWGFVNLNENARDDVFECLREAEPEPVIEHLPVEDEPPSPGVTFTDANEPLLAQPEPGISPQALIALPPEPAPLATARSPRPCWRWVLPLTAAGVVAVLTPLLWPTAQQTAIAQTPPVVAPAMPQLTPSLPLQLASVKQAPPAVEPLVLTPIAKDALVMEADQLRAGTTRFLNGDWRVLLAMKNAPSLRYSIRDNKGTARLVHGDNIVCRVAIFAGLHQNGELLIKSRGTARCSDGSRFPMPEIACKAGVSGVAACTARYSADMTVPLTFKKTGV